MTVHSRPPELDGQLALLSVAEMYAVDRAAEAAGITAVDLMATAGRAVAQAVLDHWGWRRTLVLCALVTTAEMAL